MLVDDVEGSSPSLQSLVRAWVRIVVAMHAASAAGSSSAVGAGEVLGLVGHEPVAAADEHVVVKHLAGRV